MSNQTCFSHYYSPQVGAGDANTDLGDLIGSFAEPTAIYIFEIGWINWPCMSCYYLLVYHHHLTNGMAYSWALFC